MAMKVGTKTVFYHYNAHGDVVALTNEAGDTVAEYSYDAWGNVLQATETTNEAKQNPFGYAGYTYDKEIAMYYLMARYYEPEQGIFISVDPDPGDEDDPLTMNSYNYANNNPVMHIDPDGHWVWLAINAGFAAYDGYKSYKKTKSWKKAGIAAAKGAVGGGKFKLAKKAWKGLRLIKKARRKQEDINWGHIKQRHGKNSTWKGKGKFKNNRTLKRGTRDTLRKGKSRPGNTKGSTVYEREYGSVVGTTGRGKPSKRIRVVRKPNGKIVTAFPF
ncbi:RHS repeat-associated core domain-containing protein [Listeria grandensis]|uniref:RHS repeat domain-containing protein n=1 Tax=Listeria grandensis TaxID=1494963 RepID=UPI00162723F6|nr:RHS repeat-associated core domain-containing protein [Listeria grandensis]MBC1475115.1 RHS repeat-associated core domain-containing protein [Listeria grandensis]